MQLLDDALVLSATDLNNFLACEHLTALDLAALRGERGRPPRAHRPGGAARGTRRAARAERTSTACAADGCTVADHRRASRDGVARTRARPRDRGRDGARRRGHLSGDVLRRQLGRPRRLPAPRRRAARRRALGLALRGRGHEARAPHRAVLSAAARATTASTSRACKARRRGTCTSCSATARATASASTTSRRTTAACARASSARLRAVRSTLSAARRPLQPLRVGPRVRAAPPARRSPQRRREHHAAADGAARTATGSRRCAALARAPRCARPREDGRADVREAAPPGALQDEQRRALAAGEPTRTATSSSPTRPRDAARFRAVCRSRRPATCSSTWKATRITTSAPGWSTCSARTPPTTAVHAVLGLRPLRDARQRSARREARVRGVHRLRDGAARPLPRHARLSLRVVREDRAAEAGAAARDARGEVDVILREERARRPVPRRAPGARRRAAELLDQEDRGVLRQARRRVGREGRRRVDPAVRGVARARAAIRRGATTPSSTTCERYNEYDCVSTHGLREWLLELRDEGASGSSASRSRRTPARKPEAAEADRHDTPSSSRALDARIPADFDPETRRPALRRGPPALSRAPHARVPLARGQAGPLAFPRPLRDVSRRPTELHDDSEASSGWSRAAAAPVEEIARVPLPLPGAAAQARSRDDCSTSRRRRSPARSARSRTAKSSAALDARARTALAASPVADAITVRDIVPASRCSPRSRASPRRCSPTVAVAAIARRTTC